ncbi:MAG: hypothetical protein Q8Q36_02260 [bacterium]|nr:hypothetical protein [bacterium]
MATCCGGNPFRVDLPTRIIQLSSLRIEECSSGTKSTRTTSGGCSKSFFNIGFVDALDFGSIERYDRKKEAAEATLAALREVFGEAFDLAHVLEPSLRGTLCDVCGAEPPSPISKEELERGKKFFLLWHQKIEKLVGVPA